MKLGIAPAKSIPAQRKAALSQNLVIAQQMLRDHRQYQGIQLEWAQRVVAAAEAAGK
jgi:hypothetical protein